MSRKLHTLFLFFVVLFILMVIAGCGSGNQITTPAPEGFTNSNLNGTYSFSATGTNANGFLSVAGSITANGSGTITGGSIDITNGGAPPLPANTPLTGTYNVLSDGRTQVSLTADGTTFDLDMVLLSNSNGLVISFDSGVDTASGSLDLQNASAASLATLAGSFAFNLSGINTEVTGQPPAATAGTFTFNTGGSITAGIQDSSNDGAVTSAVAITGGTVLAPTNGRGTLTLATNGVTLTLAYYVIDANHIRLVSLDSSPLPTFSGDAFRQPSSFTTSTTLPAGTFAFTLAGLDVSTGDPYVSGGILAADGNGNITSGSTQDVNVNGTLTSESVTGTYTVAATGRGTLSLSSGQSFAIYPTMTGGVLALDLGAIINDGGTILQQSGAPFSNSSFNGTYGMNFSGFNGNEDGEVNAVAQVTANGSGSLNGAFDFNNSGTLSSSQTITGSYTISANGRGTGVLNIPNASNTLGLPNLSIIHYVVSSSRILFIEADPTQPSVGVFAQQTMQ